MIVVYTMLLQSRYLDYHAIKKYSGTTFRKPHDFYSDKVDKIRTYSDCYFIGVLQMIYDILNYRYTTRVQVTANFNSNPLGNTPWLIYSLTYTKSFKNVPNISGCTTGGLLVIFQEDLWNLDWEFG